MSKFVNTTHQNKEKLHLLSNIKSCFSLILLMLYFLPFLLVLGFYPAFAQVPDYSDPYSPIFTNRDVYSWTEKIKITVIAPSWNADNHAINSIGGISDNAISISTREFELKPYKLTETDVNSGIFVGEVTLTGFEHDADGDGNIDTNPRTFGTGPTNGFLQTEQDSAITISFEFADGVVLTHSALISWNIGEISFQNDDLFSEDTAVIRIVDRDMNLNPEAIDRILVDVSSDADSAGIQTEAIEVNENSGMFEAKFSFTQTQSSSGNRLFALPGNNIFAEYQDFTLPSPYSTSDNLQITTQAILNSNVPATKRLTLQDITVSDSLGNPLQEITNGLQIQVVGTVQNEQDFGQNFVQLFQIKDSDDKVVSLSWIQGQLQPMQQLAVSQSWTPVTPGQYTVETFTWESVSSPIPLSEPKDTILIVK